MQSELPRVNMRATGGVNRDNEQYGRRMMSKVVL
jgi:hypothetical protein